LTEWIAALQSGIQSHERKKIMAEVSGNLDDRALLKALIALKKGDFSVRLPVDFTGLEVKIADTFNEIAEMNERMTMELERLGQAVGREGKLDERASVSGAVGGWSDMVSSVNVAAADPAASRRGMFQPPHKAGSSKLINRYVGCGCSLSPQQSCGVLR
jgi:hypothetical protein